MTIPGMRQQKDTSPNVTFTCDQIHEPFIDILSGKIVLPEYYVNPRVIDVRPRYITFVCDNTWMSAIGSEVTQVSVTLSTQVHEVQI